jgi:hypothetical protein
MTTLQKPNPIHLLPDEPFAVEASKEESVRTFLAPAAGEMTEDARLRWADD